jgi:hypothetical protein
VRSPNERRLLLDAAQLAVFVAMLVDLGLPWWTRTEFHQQYATFTGWGSLTAAPNYGWLVIFTAVPIAVAWWLRRRWLSLATIGWAILWLVIVLGGQASLDTHGDGYGHAGLWIGFTLVVVSVVLRSGDVIVAKQIQATTPTDTTIVVKPAPSVYS